MKDNIPGDTPLAEGPEVHSELSKVATNPKRNILILVGLVAVFGYLVMQLFVGNSQAPTTPPPPPVIAPSNVTKPVAASTDESRNGAPAVPDLPTLAAPKAPPPLSALPEPSMPTLPQAPIDQTIPQAAPVASALPSLSGGMSEEDKKKAEAKKKSSIILFGGKAPEKTEAQAQAEKDFTMRGDMSYILGRGKVMEAILESAVNTDFGGEIRAIIARDVFAVDGKLILIPKGSRAFGEYKNTIKEGSARIDITWNRIDLASGYSLNLSSQAVDNLGRAGVAGRLDNHYQEQFANAIMTSAFNIGLAGALDKLVPPVATGQTTAQTTAQSTQITNALAATSTVPGATPTSVCSAVQPLVPTTSTAYATVSAACSAALATPAAGTTPQQTMQTLVAAITAATANLSQAAAAASTPTQAQTASIQAFKDLSKSVKDLIGQNTFKPTVTIDQGKHFKIYVNKDYVFPKAAVGKSRVIK